MRRWVGVLNGVERIGLPLKEQDSRNLAHRGGSADSFQAGTVQRLIAQIPLPLNDPAGILGTRDQPNHNMGMAVQACEGKIQSWTKACDAVFGYHIHLVEGIFNGMV